mmetsp:Transcript_35118/g.42978  ORF Transcript_35118/g.42978 Transcript_35118/m.42978 type:complete len:134 (+) Transcript_35118:311-712(+)
MMKLTNAASIMIRCSYPLKMGYHHRSFSSHESVEKLRHIFEEYRKQNYTYTTPARFRKNVLKATKMDDDGIVTCKELQKLLKNIGYSHLLSHNELEDIIAEAAAVSTKSARGNEKSEWKNKRGITAEALGTLM